MSNPGTTNLEAWWKLDETSGTRVDSHGSNNLTDNNTVGYSASGKQGNAADFITNNLEFLDIVDNSSVSCESTDFSFNFWARFDSFQTINTLIMKRLASTEREYQIIYLGASTAIVIYMNDNDTTWQSQASTATINTATWYWVYGEWDNTAKKLGIQIDDGTIERSAVFTGASIAAGTASLGIGNRYWDARNDWGQDGLIDEIGFYKRLLTSAERTWLYNEARGRTYADIIGLEVNVSKSADYIQVVTP